MSSTTSCSSGGSANDEDANNVCVICLDGLLTASRNNNNTNSDSLCDIGVATPCGHPVHESCFQQWSAFQKVGSPNANKRTTAARPVPCPTCQQDTESFVKVFLRVEPDNNKSKEQQEDGKSEEFSCSDGSDGSDSEQEDDEEEENDENDNNIQAQPPARRIQPRRKSTQRNTVTSPLKLRSSATASSNNSRQIKGKQSAGKKMNHKSNSKNNQKSYHHKKSQWYKKKWMGACEQVKTLRLEAQNRQKCHHQDQMELDQMRSLCCRLVNELDTMVKMARFRRNAVGLFCFGVGWIASTKLLKYDA